MKKYTCFDAPLKVFGVPFFEENKRFERLPAALREQLDNIDFAGRRCPGARVCFRTDAKEFTVRVSLETLKPDMGMSVYAAQSVSVMVGERQNAVFAGLVSPPSYETKTFEKVIRKSAVMEDVTLWLPRNEVVETVEVLLPDEAAVEAPTPYRYGKALFYGSSITEGGCASGVTNGYVALLSRWLDLDFYNLGFSGRARGETEIADYIATLDVSLLVIDYDHNAPTVEHLRATHEPFFKRIREKCPDLPVLFLTKPDCDYSVFAKDTRRVIKTTYENALAAGDKNVYYIDGETFFGKTDRHLCTVDRIHPNDLGFYRMAKTILPVMEKMLGIS